MYATINPLYESHWADSLDRCKFTFPTPASQARESIRSWISFAANGPTVGTILTLNTLFTAWFVSVFLQRFCHNSFYPKDADLIMLALATHEPYFKVLREDVFFQDTSPGACRICGQEGHYAAQCTGTKAEVKKEPPKTKPFIFLDVSVLREYLEVELNVPQIPFPFSLEQAIDDWVLLIFFVGNDFLPHLPSLEIREGAIDTLLKIWKDELPRMGGYLTNHGQLELSRAEIILSGLARREDDIFKRRREGALSSHPHECVDQTSKLKKPALLVQSPLFALSFLIS